MSNRTKAIAIAVLIATFFAGGATALILTRTTSRPIVTGLAEAADPPPAPAQTTLPQLVEEDATASHTAGIYKLWAARISTNEKSVFAIRFPADVGYLYVDVPTAEALIRFFKKIIDGKEADGKIIDATRITIMLTSVKGARGKYEWAVEKGPEGRKKDLASATEIVAALEASIKDIEDLKKVTPAYQP